jgi:hypothetical protein
MPSIRKREANRNNAKRSTGPRSVQGKLIAKRNALRHGLAAQPAISLQSERMARAICGMGASRLQYEDALNIAESHFLVQAVRIARIAAIKRVTTVTRTLKQHVADSFELPPERAAQTTSEEQSSPEIEDDLNAFEQALAEMNRYDRYERRALSDASKQSGDLSQHPFLAYAHSSAAMNSLGLLLSMGAGFSAKLSSQGNGCGLWTWCSRRPGPSRSG